MLRSNSFLRLQSSDVATAELLLGIPSFVRPSRAKGRKALGLKYEASIKEDFSKYEHFIAGPWFRYTLKQLPQRSNYAQPDGLFIDIKSGLITIIEVKYAHTPDAYFQLIDKYIPIVQRFFSKGNWRFAVCEVVRWYDAATAFPCSIRLLEDPLQAKPGFFGVHIARP